MTVVHAGLDGKSPALEPGDASRTRRGRWTAAFWLCFVLFAGYHLLRQGRHTFARDAAKVTDLSLDFETNDFEAFFRTALRMKHGLDMYFPAGTRVELPSKKGPFFELLLQPLLPLGPAWSWLVFAALMFGLLALSLCLAGRIAEAVAGHRRARATPLLAFLLLLPFVHLAAIYTQVTPLEVCLCLLGLLLVTRNRAFTAGLVFSLPIAIKVLPIVFVPLLLWKRAWRTVAGVLAGLVLTTLAVFLHQGVERGIAQFEGFHAELTSDPAIDTYHERFQGLPSIALATITPHYETGLQSYAREVDWDGVRNFLGATGLYEHRGLVLTALLAAVVAACALACRARKNDHARRWLGETALVGLAMLLVNPHCWKHYFFWLCPAVLLALLEWRQGRARWAAVFLAITLLAETLPHKLLLPAAAASAYGVWHGYGLGVLALFAVLAVRLWRQRGEEQG